MIRMTVTGVGDARRKLIAAIGVARADDGIGKLLSDGAAIFRRELEATYRQRPHLAKEGKKARGGSRIHQAVRTGKGRTRREGPVRFAAVDRKQSPAARYLHRGTKRQKARPEIFNGAVKRARTPARQAIKAGLSRLVEALARA